jgi:uncharacterized protein (TIGR03083 family)
MSVTCSGSGQRSCSGALNLAMRWQPKWGGWSPAPEEWFRSQTSRLVAALDSAHDGEPVWTWWEPARTVGFVRRRQMIEVAVHGWDAGNAVGRPPSIPAAVATEGLQEFADVMSKDLREGPSPAPVRVVARDADFDCVMFNDPKKVSVVLEGSASDLLLSLWGRRPVDSPIVTASLACVDLS